MQRILVIDDDPAVTSLLQRGLSYEGFSVDAAASGAEGLALARERYPDLVILDVMMPAPAGSLAGGARPAASLTGRRPGHSHGRRAAMSTG